VLIFTGRLVRLIPSDPSPETTAIKAFFNHRLSHLPSLARDEWLDILELRSPLWNFISSPKRELIRSFLTTINLEILKRLRPTSSFNFQSASVGNLFLTGARLFTGSFESAIYLLGSITGVPTNVSVVPAINSNFSHHISAGLEDGTVITGQNSISHPSAPSAPPPIPALTVPPTPNFPISGTPNNEPEKDQEELISPMTRQSLELYNHDHIEDANLPGSLPTLRKQYISFAKSHTEDLPSRIERIWYINPYGQEIRPKPNSKVLESIDDASAVVYSIGSLYTSIIPCLILRDVGSKIASPNVKYKILILNGSLDRETRAASSPNGRDRVEFTAKDFIAAISDACHSSRSSSSSSLTSSPSALKAPEDTYSQYVTHLIHLQGKGTPRVEKVELAGLGIECVKLYGRKKEDEGEGDGGMIYDGFALGQALEAIIGGGKKAGVGMSRRNTMGIPLGGGSAGGN
jgi:2-phospho-L-lactate transferase/gluconeogenesis factor (CofD/UPF0052 family)